MAKQKSKKSKAKKSANNSTIALNKKSRFEYDLGDRFEAGIALQGWEVKSMRAGHAQIRDSYVMIQKGEAFLFGATFTPLATASTHIKPDPTRSRKLLLHRQELNKFIGLVDQKGFSLIPTAMYWKNNRAKLEIALAKGKKSHDKRETTKQRDWGRDKARILKRH